MIWLHLGLHKTGTTSIQGALRRTAHRRATGIWTIGDSPKALSPAWSSWVQNQAARRDVVVSDETLLGNPANGYEGLQDRLTAIRSALPSAPVSVVIALRRQSSWIESTYLQTLQEGATWGGQQFWESIQGSPFLDWTALLEQVDGILQPVSLRVLVHDPSRDAVADFFACCRLEPPLLPNGSLRENVSITGVQAPVVRKLNAALLGGPSSHVRDFMQLVAGPGGHSDHAALPELVRESIARRFAEPWAVLVSDLASRDSLPQGADTSQLAAWTPDTRPYAGDDLSEGDVAAEVTRLLLVAIERGRPPTRPSLAQRLRRKLETNPSDLPAALARTLMRRS